MSCVERHDIGGSENLEVMAEAVNYNGFLLSQVLSAMAGLGRICDFGAGCGTFARPLSALGQEVVCVEPEPGLRAGLAELGLESHGSLSEIPPNSLEGAYTLNVLEHIRDDTATLASIAERLVEGGRLYVYVPAFEVLYSPMDARVGHLRRYRLRELVGKCEQAGFQVEGTGYCDSLGFLASLLYKAFGARDGSIDRRGLLLYDRYVFPLSQALDRAASGFFGKNLWLLARRPVGPGR